MNNSTSFLFKLVKPIVRSHFKNFVSPGNLVFDVGANIGDHTQVFSELGANVVAVEPQKYCVEILEKRFRGQDNVTILEKGVRDFAGPAPFYISENYHTTSTFSEAWVSKGRFKDRFSDTSRVSQVTVDTTTLDSLISDYGVPNFCKIDVEGLEFPVVKGLSTKIACISFEFVSEFLDDAERCMRYLNTLGNVRYNYSLFIFYTFGSRTWLSSEELMRKLSKFSSLYVSGDIYARME